MTFSRKFLKTEAIVLKHFPLGEADYILTLYSRQLGKISAIAKGARRVKSKMGGHVEPLMHTSFLLTEGSNDLFIISQAELLEGFRSIREDIGRLEQGLHITELMEAITPAYQENELLFCLLRDSLTTLSDDDHSSLMTYFRLHLLELSGFRPELYICVECNSVIQPTDHRFSPDRGGTLCILCKPPQASILPLSLNSLKVLRFLLKSNFNDIHQLRIESADIMELDRIMSRLLENVIGREIKTYRFLSATSNN